ncbi:hypothetical protein H072_4257 [Dactylellina haptotyla CBS 200.50]|uniref:NFX1-type zinc finger-containing protein 1 n=1 Tax=Dactylellina haptotyla (strain CBS 200.50) TaxID=1284197 RepID=S8AFW5_DACHA|nr:hypothetical protein H072_4257 [Dactylellina haptotyla CBS 200.50]
MISGELDLWQKLGESHRAISPQLLKGWLYDTAAYFVDGDDSVRLHLLSGLSSGRPLEHLKACLNPDFLFQRHAPRINFPDHVLPILKIISDPIIRLCTDMLSCLKRIHAVFLEPSNRVWWRQVMNKIEADMQIRPFTVGPAMSGIILIFINHIGFDPRNAENVIILDSLPRLKMLLETLKDRETGGMVSPKLIDSLKALEKAVLRPHPPLQNRGQTTRRGAQPAVLQMVHSVVEKSIDDAGGRVRAFQLSQHHEVIQYLERIDLEIERGDLVSEIGLMDRDEAKNQEGLTDFGHHKEIRDIPYAPTELGNEVQAMNQYGIFNERPQLSRSQRMNFVDAEGEWLFERWKDVAKSPRPLNFDWGKVVNEYSMKSFLENTLALFQSATTETRLLFLSEYLLKTPYVIRFWECLKVKLPTDSINHPSPRLRDHVYPTLYILSHDDVIKNSEFKGVRGDMLEKFAFVPDFLYGISGNIRLQIKNRSCKLEIIEFCVNSVTNILDGVFRLVDWKNISPEFRYEARMFVDVASDMSSVSQNIDIQSLKAVKGHIREHKKKVPYPQPFRGCISRQNDDPAMGADCSPMVIDMSSTTRDKEAKILEQLKEGELTRSLGDFLDCRATDSIQSINRPQRKLTGRRQKEDEDGWNDGKSIIHQTECRPESKPRADRGAKKDFDHKGIPKLVRFESDVSVEQAKEIERGLGPNIKSEEDNGCAEGPLKVEAPKALAGGRHQSKRLSSSNDSDWGTISESSGDGSSGEPRWGREGKAGAISAPSTRDQKKESELSHSQKKFELGPRPKDKSSRGSYPFQRSRERPSNKLEDAIQKGDRLHGDQFAAESITFPTSPTPRLNRAQEEKMEGILTECSQPQKAERHKRISQQGKAISRDRVEHPNLRDHSREPDTQARVRTRPFTWSGRPREFLPPRRSSQLGTEDATALREYLSCGHPCGKNRDEKHCNELVTKVTPNCGHEALVECSDKMNNRRCWIRCDANLGCGHACSRPCHQCLVEVRLSGEAVWEHEICRTCKST